jgi:acyl-CoA synthetase (AMP-forming)/AMP-acid ligase II
MSSDRPWLKAYSPGVPADIDPTQYVSLVQLMEESFQKYASRPAYSFMGKEVSYGQTDSLSRALAAYLQGLGLAKGDRVAIMMPNVPQYPVAVAAILRAGFVVVNVNPLYTPRELEHQLKDSGSKAIVIIENFANTLQQCIANTPVKHVVLAAMGDQLGLLKGTLVNYVVRNVKKMVPAFNLPGAVRFNDAIAQGTKGTLKKPEIKSDDVAVLQYTGGTTGVSKGAVLLHRNIIANVLQSEAFNKPVMEKVPANEQSTSVCALPLYHIFAFTGGHDAVDARGRQADPDPQSARPAGGAEDPVEGNLPQLPRRQHAVQRAGQPPRLQLRQLEEPQGLARRRHGGAGRGGQVVAGQDRLPDLRRLRLVGDLALGQLQPDHQHRVHRHHRRAAAQHLLQAAGRRRQGSGHGPAGRNRDQGPAGDGRLLAAPR